MLNELQAIVDDLALRLDAPTVLEDHRLGKAQRLTGADLRDGNDRLALHLSFKLARLTERYPPPPDGAAAPDLPAAGETASPVVPRVRSGP